MVAQLEVLQRAPLGAPSLQMSRLWKVILNEQDLTVFTNITKILFKPGKFDGQAVIICLVNMLSNHGKVNITFVSLFYFFPFLFTFLFLSYNMPVLYVKSNPKSKF